MQLRAADEVAGPTRCRSCGGSYPKPPRTSQVGARTDGGRAESGWPALQVEGPDALATEALLEACLSVLAESLDFVVLMDLRPTAIANLSVCSQPPAAALGRRLLAQLGLRSGLGSRPYIGPAGAALGAQAPAAAIAGSSGFQGDGAVARAGPLLRELTFRDTGLAARLPVAHAVVEGGAGGAGSDPVWGDWESGPGDWAGDAGLDSDEVEKLRAGAVRRVRSAHGARAVRVVRRALQAPAAAGAPQPQPIAPERCENRTMVAIQLNLKPPYNISTTNNKARAWLAVCVIATVTFPLMFSRDRARGSGKRLLTCRPCAVLVVQQTGFRRPW